MKDARKELLRLGLSPKTTGFWDILNAVKLVQADLSILTVMVKGLYTEVGRQRNTTWDCVEASIRRGILTIWRYGNRQLLNDIMCYTLLGPPTPGEFLGALAIHLEDELETADH